MTRVEWTRLEGADVEAVVAMFINREHPNSTRITPSQGDGGIDILDRRAGPNGSDVVYQVKRYTEPLGSNEKNAVEGSLRTLLKDPRWTQLNVEEWHLVLPWDPSPEAEKWLQDFGREQGVAAIWNGLSHVETLATKYPEIIDYYLHGGRSRIDEAYQIVAAAFSAEHTGGGLSVSEVGEKVSKALLTLEDDPHYRYEHRFGSGELPSPSSRPGLVLHMASQDRASGRWSVVDVIARSATSTSERPIVIEGNLKLQKGSKAEKDLRASLAYGSPFQSPEGAYTGELHAPGGLSTSIDGAMISMWPLDEGLGADPELHLEVIDPAGSVLGAVDLDRIERSKGAEGLRTVLEETNGVFTIEDRHNLSGNSLSRELVFNDLPGKPVSSVLPALTFLTHCHRPNVGRLSRRHTPPEKGVIDPNLGFGGVNDIDDGLGEMARSVGLLAQLQNHSAAIIKVPDSAAVSESQPQSWLMAAKILDGEEVAQPYEEGQAVYIDLNGAPTPMGSFEVFVPLIVMVGDQQVEFGEIIAKFDTPTFLGHQDVEGRTILEFETEDRLIRYRQVDARDRASERRC